jgi:predicted Fe-Mo cluster-binding NifX family protein
MFKNRRWWVGVALLAGSALVYSGEEATPGKASLYVIGAEGKDATAQIAKLVGVAPFYHLYTKNGSPVEVVANPYLSQEYGTGPAAANMLIDKGMAVLVGRQMPGPKMKDVLDANNVRFVRRVGTVQDVASELKE